MKKLNNQYLTPIQLQERAKHRMLARRYRYGITTHKTVRLKLERPPRHFIVEEEPVFKPMPYPGLTLPSPLEFMATLLSFLPWLGARKRRREAELAQEQRSQAIKVKGVR